MADKRYYLVKQKSRQDSSFWDAPYVFIFLSKGKLESLAGDGIIFSLLELKNNEPRMKEEALLHYDIIPFNNQAQYELYRADSEGRTCGAGRFRTHRDDVNKKIIVGEVPR